MFFSQLDVCFFLGGGFSPTCNFRLLAVRTKRILSSTKPGACKNKAYVLLVRALHLTGKHRTPAGEPELILLITACLISFAFTPLLIYPSTNADLNPSLKNGENVQSSISTSLWLLDIPRFLAGSDESEKLARNHFLKKIKLCFIRFARIPCV